MLGDTQLGVQAQLHHPQEGEGTTLAVSRPCVHIFQAPEQELLKAQPET